MARSPSCPKLRGYWAFHDCGYRKGSGRCAAPGHLACCPLPYLPLRNGRLNQMSYSLFQFLRDVTGGDFVTWLLSLDNNPGLLRRTSIPLERARREAINGNSKL